MSEKNCRSQYSGFSATYRPLLLVNFIDDKAFPLPTLSGPVSYRREAGH